MPEVVRSDDVHSWLYFDSDTIWGMPLLKAWEGEMPKRWVRFPRVEQDAGTHFFVVDERFERCWRRPFLYAERLQSAGLLLSPDFSVWREMPLPVLQWQTYRNRWLGAFWQSLGMSVVPTVGWAASLDPFFWAGLPKHATVAIASIGLSDKTGRYLYEAGVAAMEEALEPKRVLVYGDMRYAKIEHAEVVEIPYSFWWTSWDASRKNGKMTGYQG